MRAKAGVLTLIAVFAAGLAAPAQDAAPSPRVPAVLRAGICGRRQELFPGLTSLSYRGGFHTKTLVYEPLFRLGPAGEPVPGLAESWKQSEDGLTWTLRLREGVISHDGARLDAAGVKEHFGRVLANPGHDWLGGCSRIRDVAATDSRTVVITLSEPWYLPGELGSINPWDIVAPGALDY